MDINQFLDSLGNPPAHILAPGPQQLAQDATPLV